MDDAAGALEPAHKAVELAPGESLPRSTLALVLGQLGQMDAAQQEADRAVALAKEDGPRSHAREAQAWLARKRARHASCRLWRRCSRRSRPPSSISR